MHRNRQCCCILQDVTWVINTILGAFGLRQRRAAVTDISMPRVEAMAASA